MISSLQMKERHHIQTLFLQRCRNDANSTTLANTLEKDIQTVFNSPEKFILELLQNADDASHESRPVDVRFRFYDGYLGFSHDGKHFDEDDVEAICDNAQQKFNGKKRNLNKTGFKGIGFKSVFVIADCTYVISKNYSFRFDRDYPEWNANTSNMGGDDGNNPHRRYPWQIIPIWTEPRDIPKILDFNPDNVNFLFRLRLNNDIIAYALNLLRNTPRTMLFLRSVHNIVIDNHGCITTISLRELANSHHHYDIYLNNVLTSSWHVLAYNVTIPDITSDQLQAMGPQECPEKLKNANSIEIKFAFNINLHGKLYPMENATLFCYLPTSVNIGLPFLVNADFLLNADRMQLLSNAWNDFLFQTIGKLHIVSLAEIALIPNYRLDVLNIFMRLLQPYTQQQFINAYDNGITSEMQKTPFIPSNTDPLRLLKYPQAIADSTEFFKVFPGIDPPLEHRLASYDLNSTNKLQHQFNLYELATIIEKYSSKSTSIQFQRKLLTFLMERYVGPDSLARASIGNIQHCLSEKRILLAANYELISSDNAYFPGNNYKQIYPKFLNIEAVHPKLLQIDGLKTWLKMLGVKELTDINLILEIENVVKKSAESFKAELSIEIVTLLCNIDTSLISENSVLSCLPLVTKTNDLIAAKYCYLPSVLSPELDIENIVDTDVEVVAERYCILNRTESLRKTLLDIGVQQKLPLCLQVPFCDIDHDRIDCFQEYYQYLINSKRDEFIAVNQANIAYVPLMRYLSNESYAEYFFCQLMEHEDALIQNLRKFENLFVPDKHSDNSCTSYLAFMLSNTRCILAEDGKYYKMSELCSPALRKRLGRRLASLLPQMKCELGQSVIKLSPELMHLLGARDSLSIKDTVELLQIAANDNSPKQQKFYKRIYLAMIKSKYNHDDERQLRNHNILLLASDNSLQHFNSLYFICDDGCDVAKSEKLIKSLPGLTNDAMAVICRYFRIRNIKRTDLRITHKNLQVNEALKKDIVNLFKLTASIEEECEHDKDSKWLDSLVKINFLAVKGLVLVNKLKPDICFEARVMLHDQQLLYDRDCPRFKRRLLEILVNHFDLSMEATTLLFELASMNTEADRLDWLTESGYDISKLGNNIVDKQRNKTSSAKKRKFAPSCNSITEGCKIDNFNTSTPLRTDISCATAAMITKRRNYKELEDTSTESTFSKTFVIVLKDCQSSFNLNSEDCQSNHLANLKSASSVNHRDISLESQGSNLLSNNSKVVTSGNNTVNLRNHSLSAPKITNGKANLSLNYKHIQDNSLDVTNAIDRERCETGRTFVTESMENDRAGKKLVFNLLQQHYRKKYPKCNYEESEFGFLLKGVDKYDRTLSLEVIRCNSDVQSDGLVDMEIIKNSDKKFIKIKSANKDEDMVFRANANDWKCMRLWGERFRLFCVYDAGQPDNARIKKVKNPALLLLADELVPVEICFKL